MILRLPHLASVSLPSSAGGLILFHSDKANAEIGRGYHYGIEVDGIVYDNMTLDGLEFEAWIEDLGIGRFGGIDWKYSGVILDR